MKTTLETLACMEFLAIVLAIFWLAWVGVIKPI